MPVLFILGYNEIIYENDKLNSCVESSRPSGLLTVFDLTDLHVERFLKA